MAIVLVLCLTIASLHIYAWPEALYGFYTPSTNLQRLPSRAQVIIY